MASQSTFRGSCTVPKNREIGGKVVPVDAALYRILLGLLRSISFAPLFAKALRYLALGYCHPTRPVWFLSVVVGNARVVAG